MFARVWITLLGSLYAASAATVTLPQGKYVGANVEGIDFYYGIPFAQPPVGDLRLRAPKPITKRSNAVYNATVRGKACPQAPSSDIEEGEDCLHVNIFAPHGANEHSKLPVMFWIYGGSFKDGNNNIYDGTRLVQQSIKIGKPVVFVAVNYRVNAFGFLCSAELKAESPTSLNLGLRDQRAGLEWVHENIRAFGGDPKKVTMFGESAGAISASLQLVASNGDIERKGLVRAAIFQSGSVNSANAQPPNHRRTQDGFNQLVQLTGCANASNKPACLRKLSYEEFNEAMLAIYEATAAFSLKLPFVPCVDGQFIADRPITLLQKGKVADIPVISGDNTDEGTLFNIGYSIIGIDDTAELIAYLQAEGSGLSGEFLNRTLELYPDDPTFGSPFGTGNNFNLYPQYKRANAILGDFVFEAPRRQYLSSVNKRSPQCDVWSYRLDQPMKNDTFGWILPLPQELMGFLGVPHAADIPFLFGIPGSSPDDKALSTTMQSLWISFANHLDPNHHGLPRGTVPNWPPYGREKKQIVLVQAPNRTVTIETDNYRKEQMDYFNEQSTIEGSWQ